MIGTTQRQTFTKILGASVVLHLGAVALFFVIADAHSKPEPKTVIATKLVRLGKERPKELLPRLAKEAPPQPAPAAPPAPKPPPPKTPKSKPQPKTKAPPKPASKPKPAVKQEKSAPSTPSVSSALTRLKSLTSSKGDDVPEGAEDGSVLGEAAKRVLGNRYVGEVYTRFKAAYALEGIDAQNPALAGKSVVIAVWISRRGTVERSKVLKASGVEAFDRSVEKTLKRVRDVPAPPKEIWDLVSDGIEIEFSPR